MMICKVCGKDVKAHFSGHVGNHRNLGERYTLKKYFEEFPEEKYIHKEEKRKIRSAAMKKRYEKGDILSPEQRAKVISSGAKGWQRKISESTPEERKRLLKNFTSAGNNAQIASLSNLDSIGWKKRFPFGIGDCIDGTCDECNANMFIWTGERSRGRPKNNFCSKRCKKAHKQKHPDRFSFGKTIKYTSSKTGTNLNLRSAFEVEIAKLLDHHDLITTWSPCSFRCPYKVNGKIHHYYPDFVVNEKHVIEVKSTYVRIALQPNWPHKMIAGIDYCNRNGLRYHFWEFSDIDNCKMEKFKHDERFLSLFRSD